MTDADASRRSGDTVDQVVRSIRAEIVAGAFRPGQRLVARALTDASGYSRGTVREALRRLAADGLITLTPNRGAAVRQLSRRDMREMFQLRELLEGLAARLAAERIGEGGRRAAFAAMWRQVRHTDAAGFNADNHRFHAAIMVGGQNVHLAAVLERMQLPILMMQIRQSMTQRQIEMSLAEHVVIADAILAGDGAAAEAAMRAHLARSRKWVLSLPDSAFSVPQQGF